MMLPIECVESIVLFLAPIQRFHVATDCRFIFIQRHHCLPWLNAASMNHASGKGQIDLLEAWKTSGLPLEDSYYSHDGIESYYSHYAMEWASLEGHVDVLDWWKTSGLAIKTWRLRPFKDSNNGWWDVSFARRCILEYERYKNRGQPVHDDSLLLEQRAMRVSTWWNENVAPIYTE